MGRRVSVTSTYRRRHTYTTPVPLSIFVMDCSQCGVPYGFSTSYEDRRRDDGEGWFCPNGHSQAFSDSGVDRERQRANRAEAELKRARIQREEAKVDAAYQRHVAAGHKAHATKLRNLMARGVCPWCPNAPGNRPRSFLQVQRHVKTKHPERLDLVA